MAGHCLPHLGDYRYTIEADYNGSKLVSNLSPNENFTTSYHAVCYIENVNRTHEFLQCNMKG